MNNRVLMNFLCYIKQESKMGFGSKDEWCGTVVKYSMFLSNFIIFVSTVLFFSRCKHAFEQTAKYIYRYIYLFFPPKMSHDVKRNLYFYRSEASFWWPYRCTRYSTNHSSKSFWVQTCSPEPCTYWSWLEFCCHFCRSWDAQVPSRKSNACYWRYGVLWSDVTHKRTVVVIVTLLLIMLHSRLHHTELNRHR